MSLGALDAVILCGGLGTRLLPVLPQGQKTMADVAGRPFLQIVVDWLRAEGLRRIIFCAGYRADEIQSFFQGRHPELELHFSVESAPLGTAGALKNCESLLRSPTTLVLNGDSFCPARLDRLAQEHVERRAVASILAVAPGERRDGGTIIVSPGGRVVSFAEKAFDARGLLNAGVYLLEREFIASIPAGQACSLEREALPAALERGVYASACSQPLYDIGTPERLEAFRLEATNYAKS